MLTCINCYRLSELFARLVHVRKHLDSSVPMTYFYRTAIIARSIGDGRRCVCGRKKGRRTPSLQGFGLVHHTAARRRRIFIFDDTYMHRGCSGLGEPRLCETHCEIHRRWSSLCVEERRAGEPRPYGKSGGVDSFSTNRFIPYRTIHSLPIDSDLTA